MPIKAFDFVPSLTVQKTTATVFDQKYTYNQAGFSYNQAAVDYGGIYNLQQDVSPSVSLAFDFHPVGFSQNTQAQLLDQGYTYNQASFSYNKAGVDYSGLYKLMQDIVPTVSMIDMHVPMIANYADIYTVPGKNSGMLMGILGLTYP